MNGRTAKRYAGWLAAIAALLVASACRGPSAGRGKATQPGILHGPGEPVVITRAGEELAITWKTRPGETYTVVYKDRPGAHLPWERMPGYDRIAGTGQSQTVRLPTWPGDTRRFNVVSGSGRQRPSVRPARP